jgi:putative DNA methylase
MTPALDCSMTQRLIETWLPIAEVGIESTRGLAMRKPPTNRLHVWWARRPLVAARAAILASLLPASADREKFRHVIGIHGDPVATRRRLFFAKKNQENLGSDPYGYPRAFQYSPTDDDLRWLDEQMAIVGISAPSVVDSTAGGGSIPFESLRLGLRTYANDLNPVASLILRATAEWPIRLGKPIIEELKRLGSDFIERAKPKFEGIFPKEPEGIVVLSYLWARTIRCPYCDGLVPLSPNWRLAPDGTGVRIKPHLGNGPGDPARHCEFEIVATAKNHSHGTVSDGDATCPYLDCGRVVNGDEIKRQAQAGGMGEQLFAVVFKRRVETRTKSGNRGKDKWTRGYRASRPEDDNSAAVLARLAAKLPEWEALDCVPSENLPMDTESWTHGNTPAQYGARTFADLFSPRQLLGHGTAVEVFRELLGEEEKHGLSETTRAAFVYLALSLDKMRDYNSRMTRWHSKREVMVNTFDRHDFASKSSYAEMPPLIAGNGYEWAITETAKCVEELVDLVHPSVKTEIDLLSAVELAPYIPPEVTVTCKSADSLEHIADRSVDVVVMDPPYYDNVMYAELSDFFFVWLKRTAGHVVPELFTRHLTDKENEAVANVAKFAGQKGAKALAGRDYQERMKSIFAECSRVLKADGIMTIMFTHKATGAWDALAMGLMEAGFKISASWPINTEGEDSLHIRDKSAAKSTIFLVCRPRTDHANEGTTYWEEVEPLVAKAVRTKVEEFQKAGIGGVDLYLACFGPALEEFSNHWPLKRGNPRPTPETKKRRKQAELFEEEWNPYAVTPEDALDAARREVKRWRLEQLTQIRAKAELDGPTSWFVLAWDAFQAPVFPYDEALRLARAVGVDLEKDIVGRLAEKKASDLVLWDSAKRAAKGALGPADGSRGMIDALHHAANLGRTRTLDAAKTLVERNGLDGDPAFLTSLKAVLEVLPVSKAWTGVDLEGDVAEAGNDFEALEKLRTLAWSARVSPPKQLDLWAEDTKLAATA